MKRLCHLLLALLPAVAAASEGWTNRVEIADRHAVASITCAWSENGVMLQLAATNHAAMEFRITPGRKPELRLTPERLFPPEFEDQVQLWPAPAPAANRVTITLRRQSHAWMLYVADEPVARFPEPWASGAVILRQDTRALPPDGTGDPYVQRTAAFRFDDAFMIAKTATNQFPETWERYCGSWHLHSVTGALSGTVSRRGLARQPTPERSPNFYCLEGHGPHGVVLSGEPFYHRYSFRASVQHNGGTNGLVFLVTDAGACHGFTASTDPETEHLVFQLWQGGIAAAAPRQVLATIATELLAGQWTLMEVRIFDDRIVCLADNIEILRQRLPLPPGGRFGLIEETDQSTRFDDVSVASHEDYPFESVAELRFHTLQQSTPFRNCSGDLLHPAGGEAAPVALESQVAPAPRTWIFGATDDGPHKLDVCLQPATNAFACTLLAGWQGALQPYYQLTCRQQGRQRVVSLERVSATTVAQLDSATLEATSEPLRLTLDALRPDELRGFVNGRLVVIDRPATPVAGAGGIRLDGASIRLSLPQYVSAAPVYTDRFEKNPAYVNDPFMRHWAAPEGQWITMRDGLTWLRGDILGRVRLRLPVVDPSVLHLAIPEDGTNGQCVVAIRDQQLTVQIPATGTNAAVVIHTARLPAEPLEKGGFQRFYTVNFEDDLLWISTDAAILGRCHLPPLSRARRARIEGLSLDQLHLTMVCRENVFDTLFNESLFNWTINGGTWEVVNRFQCEPTWSHMNGESTNSFAGLWSNVELAGDFCVEFYAGMRMGWYDRPGDFNLTVHSQRQTPCDGYSATLAGWDPDHSQLYTRLFRNGDPVAVSTAYTAPRVRDGSVRRGYEPLITSASRPVHGAWYGMRLRRVGDQLTYLFDNEPVLSWRDPYPLEAGSLGIWTYCNSIMVARVRIAAESVRPRPFKFWSISGTPPARAAEPAAALPPAIRVNGRPAELLDPAIWQDADPVSRPMVRHSPGPDGRPEMRVTALQGSGTFLVAPHLPPSPASQLLGWHFEIARHPEARINFEFSAGRSNEKNTDLLPESIRPFSFVINGSADARGLRQIAGALAHPPAASQPDAESRECAWTPVDVWVPAEVLQKQLALRIDGFGNLQHSDIQQGLAGNPPGAWYAIRNFHEIYSAVPEFDGPADLRAEIDAVAGQAAQLPRGQLNTLRLPAVLDARTPLVAWVVRPEAEFGLVARPDPVIPEAVRIVSAFPWSSALLPARSARLDDQPATGWLEGNDYVALLPRSAGAQAREAAALQLELADGRTFKQTVPLATSATSQPPVLLACEMPEGGIQTFESRTLPHSQGRATPELCCTDPQQGAFLRLQNNGLADARLDGRILPVFDPVVTPLLQFRYKADSMAHVSLTAGRCNIGFSENTGTLAAVGATGILDNAWHTWMGTPIQTAASFPLRSGFVVPPADLRVGSRGSPDQTGYYSAFDVDDIACSPVIGPRHPLTFQLSYSSRDPLSQVLYAIAPGPAPWTSRSSSELEAVRWVSVTNRQLVAPDLTGLPEGPHHLITRACSERGAWSAVYDLPFVITRHPPQVSAVIRTAPDRYNGTFLDLHIAGCHVPPQLNNLRLSIEGKPLDLTTDNGQCTCHATTASMEIDWPWLLRKKIRACNDGDTLTLTLDGITDAAGNQAPLLQIPIKIDFANDKQPPAVLPLQNTTNLFVYAPRFHAQQDFFNSSQQISAQEPQQENGCQFVPFHCQGGDETFLARKFSDKPWDPEAFPWLAISVRIENELTAGDAPFELRLRPAGTLPEQAVKPRNGDCFTWSLPTADNQPFVVGHVDWKPGQWVDLLVNVRDLLRDLLKQPKACALREVAFAFPPKAKLSFQIRGMAILAPWSAADVLKFRAYDLSGIAGAVWQNGGQSTRTGIRPACLHLPPDDAQWLKLRVSDRPGNLTPVFMVPLPPNTAPVPENMPPDVDVEDY